MVTNVDRSAKGVSNTSLHKKRGGITGVAKYVHLFNSLAEKQFVLDKVYIGHSLYEWDESNSPYTLVITKAYSFFKLDAILLSFRVVLGFLTNFFESQPYARVVVTNGLPTTEHLHFIPKVEDMLGRITSFYYLRWVAGSFSNRIVLSHYWKYRLYRKLKNIRLAVWRDATRRVVSRISWLPDLIIALSVYGGYAVMVKEAFRLKLPLVGVVDNNCSEKGTWYSVRGNDDSYRSLLLYVSIFKGAIENGKRLGLARYLSSSRSAEVGPNQDILKGGDETGEGGSEAAVERITMVTLALQRYIGNFKNQRRTTLMKLFKKRATRTPYDYVFIPFRDGRGRNAHFFFNNKWVD